MLDVEALALAPWATSGVRVSPATFSGARLSHAMLMDLRHNMDGTQALPRPPCRLPRSPLLVGGFSSSLVRLHRV